jgi:hypothetical protein
MELGSVIGIYSFGEWSEGGSAAMSSGKEKEFETYARDCVKLAEQADTRELRESLLDMARDWMKAAMDEEDSAQKASE